MTRTSMNRHSQQRVAGRSRRGATLVVVAIMFTVLLSFAALALDTARMYSFKAELKRTADAAAMSAVRDLEHGKSEGTAETNAIGFLGRNTVEGSSTPTMTASDITGITWNFATQTSSAAGSWGAANGVSVTAKYTASWTLGKVFGASTRVLSETSIAAIGSLTSSNCLKPFAFPYGALLAAVNYSPTTDMSHQLTKVEINTLISNQTAISFPVAKLGTATPNFAWVNVTGSNGNGALKAALDGCASIGMGVDSSLADVAVRGNSVQGSLDALCGQNLPKNGSVACTNMTPILVPVYDPTPPAPPGNYTIKLIAAFRLTQQDQSGLTGYMTFTRQLPSGILSGLPGPVQVTKIVN